MVPKGLERELEELEIRGRIETIQITVLFRSEYSEDLQRFDVTLIPVNHHQLILVWKICKE